MHYISMNKTSAFFCVALACVLGYLFVFHRGYHFAQPAAYFSQPESLSVAFVTVPNSEVAKSLSRGILEKKLAACVNAVPGVTSMYWWQGKIEEASEQLLMIKTRTHLIGDLISYVKQNHPYSVPEVITFPIDQGNAPYLDWIKANTQA
eukprot:TRINITY_DN5770_c0_g2_i2.p1 TRINITY_DN5770_c0_g2~~TRINITY_DN5770_c0_g2_i2.p1  ORF type:complete len:149 (-),score=8.35 TRINITY_DN5770_c0_g2_i2:14-460(-)